MRAIGLDLARCVAAAMVVLAHIGQAIGHPVGEFFGVPGFYHVSIGGLGVTVFLVLSGAALQMQYGHAPIAYPGFVARRLLRIYPAYYASLLLSILIYLARASSATEGIWRAFPAAGASDILLSLTAGYAFAGAWGGPFVGTSWFIALIVSLYLVFPPLSRAMRRHPHATLAVLLLVSVVSRLILGSGALLPNRPLDWFPLCRAFEFGLGIYLSTIMPRLPAGPAALPGSFRAGIVSFSRLSLPLFLMHTRVTFLMPYLIRLGRPPLLAIAVFLLASLALSAIVLVVDDRVPRAALLARAEALASGIAQAWQSAGSRLARERDAPTP